jgi:hypothetical protein
MHQPMSVTTRTDMIATKIRVEMFEILKQKSNSAMKKITIDHISNAQGRPKIIAIGSRPKIL